MRPHGDRHTCARRGFCGNSAGLAPAACSARASGNGTGRGGARDGGGGWADGLVSDEEFVRGIEYMIENGIVQVRPADRGVDAGGGGEGAGAPAAIPQWVKAGAKRWADGLVPD